MPGLGLHLGQRLEQRLEQRLQLALGPGDMVDPFRTDGEEIQVSQYAILKELLKLINEGEYFDTDHFGLEINRTIFGHPLEARLGNFGRDLSEVVRFYQSDEELAKRVISALGKQKEEGDKKDIPGQISSAWNRINKSDYFSNEANERRIVSFIEHVSGQEGDVSSGIDIVGRAAELPSQKPLVDTSFEKVKSYASEDARIIPFTQRVLIPVFRALGRQKERLTAEEAQAVYGEVVEPLYMLDRDLRVSGTIDKLSSAVDGKGIRQLLGSTLPIPLQVSLEAISPSEETYNAVLRLCGDSAFTQGRELKRKVYRGLSAVEDIDEGRAVLEHIVENVSDSSGFARVLSALNLVYNDPDFAYPFEISGEKEVLRNLKLQLVDKSIKRLGFDDETLEKYLTRLESDEQFERIGKMVTTLVGYDHYQNQEQLGLLREIAEVKLDGKFKEWRYSHDRAEAQLRVLGKDTSAWKENKKVSRIVGELQALNAHIDSIKNILPKIMETYAEHYGRAFRKETTQELEAEIAQNEDTLRSGELSKKERKKLGYETHQLREHLSYVGLLSGLADLNTENYSSVLEQAEGISRKKSRNPLYENAKWIRETLDEPVYRDARKITVYETDDLETLLRFGETPVPHCQNWKVDSSLNRSLLSFVADANKKLYHVANGNDRPIAMSMLRLLEWDNVPTLLIENVYDQEWSDDYGIALLGSLADKAMAMHEETGKEVRVATTSNRLKTAMERFSEKYKVEVLGGHVDFDPAPSKNKFEYWDCGPGLKDSGSRVSFGVEYISFGGDSGY